MVCFASSSAVKMDAFAIPFKVFIAGNGVCVAIDTTRTNNANIDTLWF